MILLSAPIDSQEDFLGKIFGFFGIADKVVHHRDEAVMVQLNEFSERLRVIFTNAQHQADIRIAERQLRAALAGQIHNRLAWDAIPSIPNETTKTAKGSGLAFFTSPQRKQGLGVTLVYAVGES
jgi:hypothetical protein